jgi:hypothetical protein
MPQEGLKLNLAQLSIIGARSEHRQGFEFKATVAVRHERLGHDG